MNPICFYHSADLDGVCSGAIVKHFVPDVELVGYDYGQPFPWDKVRPGIDAENDPLWAHLYKPENGYVLEVFGDPPKAAIETLKFEKRTVYVADVSLPPEDMRRLAEVSNLVWIDHHASQEGLWAELQNKQAQQGLFRIGTAACELCWEFFNPLQDAPEAVRLLGSYDVWRKDDPEWEKILAFQYGCRVINNIHDPEHGPWLDLFAVEVAHIQDQKIREVVRDGRMLLRYQAEVNRRACELGNHVQYLFPPGGPYKNVWQNQQSVEGFTALCCNTIVFNSQFFDGFYDPEKHDVMVPYCKLADGRWKVSLYSTKPEIDCGAICMTFGGGGYKGAAGFICDKLPWEK